MLSLSKPAWRKLMKSFPTPHSRSNTFWRKTIWLRFIPKSGTRPTHLRSPSFISFALREVGSPNFGTSALRRRRSHRTRMECSEVSIRSPTVREGRLRKLPLLTRGLLTLTRDHNQVIVPCTLSQNQYLTVDKFRGG